MSHSCPSKPPSAGEEIALKMVVQPSELTAKLLPRPLQHLSCQHAPCHTQSVHAESTPGATAPHPPSLQTQPLPVAGLEELAKITDI